MKSIDRYEAWLQATCETFVIKPPDFDWQNILVDDNGNIIGLLDWDGVCTVPRFQGFAPTPKFLQQDYLRTWYWEGDGGCSDRDLARYRKAYANFMAEARGNRGDCIYTAKSPFLDVFYGGCHKEDKGWTDHAARTILRILLPRSDFTKYLIRIGDEERVSDQASWCGFDSVQGSYWSVNLARMIGIVSER